MNRIKCSVEECIYQSNDRCYADAVKICSSGDMAAGASPETACKTFFPKSLKK